MLSTILRTEVAEEITIAIMCVFVSIEKTFYPFGTSVNHVGSKTFSLNKLEDKEILTLLISKVENEFKVSN